jgi:protein tyrosine phosphatase domain-containing protein 1
LARHPFPLLFHLIRCHLFLHLCNKSPLQAAVHCHAGLGRTGLVIACWLIFEHKFAAERAVALVRANRPGSVQTRAQSDFCGEFEAWVQQLRCVYTLPPAAPAALRTLAQALSAQRTVLHGPELLARRHVPKAVALLCDRVRAAVGALGATPVAVAFVDVGPAWAHEDEVNLANLKRRMNGHDWYGLDAADVRYLAQLLLDWFEQVPNCIA